jgi:F0F1-type ATP synthase assembly protein I
LSSNQESKNFTTSSFRRMSESLRQAGPYIGAVQAGAIILLGGIGYFIDKWRESFPFWFMIGVACGIVVGLYEMAKVIWRDR